MLTQQFRDLLEYQLSKALAKSDAQALRRYWCDGVLESERAEESHPDYVAKSRRLILRAWMQGSRTKGAPLTHQLHPLHLVLGPASLTAYLQGQDLLPWIAHGIDPAAVMLDTNAKLPTFLLSLP